MIEIPLTHGAVTLVDDADEERARAWRWHTRRHKHTSYAGRNIKMPNGRIKCLLLHRWLMMPPHHMDVDHIDGNGLNNQRSNLRIVTTSENIRNRRDLHEMTGVTWNRATRKWVVNIDCNGKRIYVGLFADVEEAKRARLQAEAEHWGEFARKVVA